MIMKKIKFDNVMKIADLHHTNISEDAIKMLISYAVEWEDKDNNEHIFGLYRFLDEAPFDYIAEDVLNELENISDAMNKKDCSYLRIIY